MPAPVVPEFFEQLYILVTPVFAAIAAVPLAIVGIVSDLIESVIKRRAGWKDSGSTFPGIGGVFDLTDSLVLTAPLGYLLFGLN